MLDHEEAVRRVGIIVERTGLDAGLFGVHLSGILHLLIVGSTSLNEAVSAAIHEACVRGVASTAPDELILAVALRHERARPVIIRWADDVDQLKASA